MLRFASEVCADLHELTRREWLVANGIGGYASSTLCFLNTRRYHGMLVAALQPPVARTVLVAKCEETVRTSAGVAELGCNAYPKVVYPDGYEYLQDVRLELGVPSFSYRVLGGTLLKTVAMVQGQNTTLVRYMWDGPAGAELLVHPLITCRDYHWLKRFDPWLSREWAPHAGGAWYQPYELGPRIYVSATEGTYCHDPVWYYNFQYEQERQRGLEFEEDLYRPGELALPLASGEPAYLVLSTEPRRAEEAPALFDAEMARRHAVLRRCPMAGHRAEVDELILAADSFLVRRGSGLGSILAGYHWFGDWGRDTMIALPGLTLTTGRAEDARQILLTYAEFVDQGMLPNRFPDSGEAPDYNTVDATLWYFVALHYYVEATGDLDTARRLLPVLMEIIRAHVRGTRYGIGVDSDGLLAAGDERTQLTWMDAKVDDWVVTPRNGKPVEINALWYNALRITADLAGRLAMPAQAREAAEHAERAAASFVPAFHDAAAGYLADRVVDGVRDQTLRPNQLLAASLPYKLIDAERTRQMLDRIDRGLLTPHGLRTLAPSEPGYRGIYLGDRWARDGAYHQGTAWAWLIGPYVDAWLYAHAGEPGAERAALGLLDPLRRQVYDAGVGSLSEIYDGAAPHEPRGCISQAWSVGEALRILGRLLPANAPAGRPSGS
ncbi:MAG TPA: amylo-alpha-1,6-glucosidase [Armatimonadota bacterium]|nr:amylo-alpha-1,6-glucosidase [Armatimonadota bacterium]